MKTKIIIGLLALVPFVIKSGKKKDGMSSPMREILMNKDVNKNDNHN